MSDVDVVVFGSINEDVTVHLARMPEAGETVGGRTLRTGCGGKGANQAVAAARLGARTAMVGSVGTDPAGQRQLDALHDAGVDTTGVRLVGAATGTALVLVDDDGENRIVVVPGANELPPTEGDLVRDAAVLICQLEVPVPVVAAMAAAASGFFVLNAAPAMAVPSALLARCDLLVMNETERDTLGAVAPSGYTAVTLGAAGALLLRDGREIARAAAPRVEVVDTIGAGDAFVAALAIALARGWDPRTALEAACLVGADAVQHPGARPWLHPLEHYRPSSD